MPKGSAGGDQIHVTDSQLDFSGGIDSNVVTTIASQSNPTGLKRNQTAWLINATVRDGGITQRGGWTLQQTIADGSAIYQGG